MIKKNLKQKKPEIVYKNGQPCAVILKIEEYKKMLTRLEDIEDLEMLKEMRKKPLKFKKLDDYLEEQKHI